MDGLMLDQLLRLMGVLHSNVSTIDIGVTLLQTEAN